MCFMHEKNTDMSAYIDNDSSKSDDQQPDKSIRASDVF